MAGQEWGRVRALHAVGGAPVDGAGPSSVVNVVRVGFRSQDWGLGFKVWGLGIRI